MHRHSSDFEGSASLNLRLLFRLAAWLNSMQIWWTSADFGGITEQALGLCKLTHVLLPSLCAQFGISLHENTYTWKFIFAGSLAAKQDRFHNNNHVEFGDNNWLLHHKEKQT